MKNIQTFLTGALLLLASHALYGETNLVLYYSFNTNSTGVPDESGYGHTGTVYGATFVTNGYSGGAYSFDGTNDYIGVNGSTNLNFSTNDFSITAWIKAKSSQKRCPTIIARRNVGSLNNGYSFFLWDDGKLAAQLAPGSSYINAKSTSADLRDGVWHNVVMSADRDKTVVFYVDGVKNGEINISSVGNINSTNNLSIGWDAANSGETCFFGDIDNVCVFTTALSSNEVMALYQYGAINLSNVIITAITPSPGSTTNGTNFNIQLGYTNDLGGLDVASSILSVSNSTSAVGGEWLDTTNLLIFTPSNSWSGGDYSVYAKLEDMSGRTSQVFTSTFSVDLTPPAAPVVTNDYEMGTVTNALDINPVVLLCGTNESGSTVWLNDVQTQPVSSNAWKLTFIAPGGVTTNMLYAVDTAGNRSSTNLIVFSVTPYDVLMTNSFSLTNNDVAYTGQNLIISGSNTTATITGEHNFGKLYLLNGAKITHEVGNTNGLQLTVSDTLYIATNSSIDVSGKGSLNYLGQIAPTNVNAGGSYGGRGSLGGGASYGDYYAPAELGSGCTGSGTRGGGRVKLSVGTLMLNGDISANGQTGNGGGSGGAIWLIADTLNGSGSIYANGGSLGNVNYGSGGGGRVAIYYTDASGFGLTNRVMATGGIGYAPNGGPGSVYLKNTNQSLGILRIDNSGTYTGTNTQPTVLGGTIADPVVLVSANVAITNNTVLSSLTASNSMVSQSGALTAGVLTVSGGTWTQNGTLTVSNLVLRSGAVWTQNGTLTAGSIDFTGGTFVQNAALDIGSSDLTVNGWTWACNIPQSWANITVTNGGKITHSVGNTNGLQLTVGDTLYIAPGCSIDVSGKGSSTYSGTGTGVGGSYGGKGGTVSGTVGPIYGSYFEPVDLGSAGYGSHLGGGRVRVVAGSIVLDGDILAKGADYTYIYSYHGGGSGGSIWINCADELRGGGTISASGGSTTPYGGGGGGGRIAIYHPANTTFDLIHQISCSGGSGSYLGAPGGAGSIYIVGSNMQVNTPVVTNFSAIATNNVTNTTLTLQGTKDADTSVWANWQQIASNSAATIWLGSVTLTQGVNQVLIYTRDTAGNCSEVSTRTFFVDSIAPALGAMVPANGSQTNVPLNDITLNYTETGSGLDANGTRISLSVSCVPTNGGGALAVNGDWIDVSSSQLKFVPYTSPLLAGTYTVKGRLFDNFGLKTSFTNSFIISFDVPTAPEINPLSVTTSLSRITFTGTKQNYTALYMDGTNLTGYTSATSWSKEVTSLQPGVNSFGFSVQNLAGTYSATTTATVVYTDTPPARVTALTAITNGIGTQITLCWTNYSEYGADISKYRVYQTTNSFTDTAQTAKCFTNAAGVQTLLVTGLVRSVTNWYAVVPEDMSGKQYTNSLTSFGFAPKDIVPPLVPAPITFVCDTNSLTLNWPQVNDVYGDFSTYCVYVTNSSAAIETTTNTFTLNGLVPASNYHFEVSSKDQSGNESSRTSTNGYTLFSANPTVDVVSTYSHQATIQWTSVSPTNNLLKYAVYTSTNWFTNVTGMTQNVFATGTNQTVVGLADNVTNWIAVTAINKSGGELKTVAPVWAKPLSDTEGPELSGLKWNNTAIIGNLTATETFSITASDPANVSWVKFWIGDELIATKTGGGTQSAFWNVAATPSNGAYQLKITAQDLLFNVSTQITEVTVALEPPSAPTITDPANNTYVADGLVFVSGSGAKWADSVRLYLNGSCAATGSVTASGTFRIPVAVAVGTNTIQAVAVNRAGEGTPSVSVRVIYDTSVPQPPVGVAAAPREDGQIRLSWFAPSDTEVKYYKLYSSLSSFTSTNDAGVSSMIVGGNSYMAYTTTNALHYFRMSTVDKADRESILSSQVSATSDAILPMLSSIQFSSTGPADMPENRFGVGTVTMVLQVSETLAADPFFTIKPQGGSPVSISLRRTSTTQYTGTYTINESTPSGNVTMLFSGKDLAGNWGTAVSSGIYMETDTVGPAVTCLTVQPEAPIQNNNTNPVSAQVTVEFDPSDIPVGAPLLSGSLTKSGSTNNITLTQTADPSVWTGSLTLPPDAGETAESLVFHYQGADDFGNVSTIIRGENAFQVYQGELPPLDAPTGLTGKALPGGWIELEWSALANAAGYVVGVGSSSNTVADYDTDVVTNSFTANMGNVTNWYAVKSLRVVGSQISTSEWSRAVQIISDDQAPAAPTDLALSLGGTGMGVSWNCSEADVTYSVYRSNADFSGIFGMTPILSNVVQKAAVDSTPANGSAYYGVIAVDEAGNQSGLSATVYTNLSLVPVDTLRVTRMNSDLPVVSWTYPNAGNISGFNLSADGVSLADGLAKTSTNYADSWYTGSNRTYSIEAYDASATGMPRTITLPEMSLALNEASTLKRGVMNRLYYDIFNFSPAPVSNAVLQVDVNGIAHFSDPFTVSAVGTASVSVVVGGYTNLPSGGVVTLTNSVVIKPNAGEEVRIGETGAMSVGEDTLSLEIQTDDWTRGGTGKARFVLRNTSDVDVEIITAQNGVASPEVRFSLENADGFTLSAGELKQTTGGVMNHISGLSVAHIPAGGSFTSGYVELPVPADADATLYLRLQIDWLHFNADGGAKDVKIRGLTGVLPINLTETTYAADVTNITPAVAYGSTNITISGIATNRATGLPAKSIPVDVVVSVNGFDRTLNVFTDTNGMWNTVFTPLSGEGGNYFVFARHPTVTARLDQGAGFIINRLLVNPASISLTAPKNIEKTISLNVKALASVGLTNLTVALAAEDQVGGVLPQGIAFTNQTSLAVLPAGQSGTLRFGLLADNTATSSVPLKVRITGDGIPGGIWARIPLNCRFVSGGPQFFMAPGYLQTGVTNNGTVVETLKIENTGYDKAENIQLALTDQYGNPAPDWAVLNCSTNQGTLNAGSSMNIGLTFSPDSSVAQITHNLKLTVSASNADPLEIPLIIGVEATGTGGMIFRLTDIYTFWDNPDYTPDYTNAPNYYGLNGAKIQLVKDSGSIVQTNRITANGGIAEFANLPAGSYQLKITADKHDTYTDHIWIRTGVTDDKTIFLKNSLVTVDWSVTPTTIEDHYTITTKVTFETHVPAPVIVIEPPMVELPEGMEVGEVYRGEIRMSNRGSISTTSINAMPSLNDPRCKLEWLVPFPENLAAGESVVLPYQVIWLDGGEMETGAEDCPDGATFMCLPQVGTYEKVGCTDITIKSKCVNETEYVDYETWCLYVLTRGETVCGCYVPGGTIPYSYSKKEGSGTKAIPNSPACNDPCKDLEGAAKMCCELKNSDKAKSRVYLSMGEYRDDATDLTLPLLGHQISIKRSLRRQEFEDKSWAELWTFDLFSDRVELDSSAVDAYSKLTVNGTLFTRYRMEADRKGLLPADCDLEKYGVLYADSRNNRLEVLYDDLNSGTNAVLTGFRRTAVNGSVKEYDESGYLLSDADRNGAQLQYGYTDGEMTGLFDHFTNQVLWLGYSNGQLESVSDGLRTVSYSYTGYAVGTNMVFALTGVNDIMGHDTEYRYGLIQANHLAVTSKLYPSGEEVTIDHDIYGRVSALYNNRGYHKDYTYNYNSSDDEYYARIVAARGTVTERRANGSGAQLEKKVNGETVPELPSSPFEPVLIKDDNGNVLRQTNPDGSFRTYQYEGPNGELTKEVNEAGTVTFYAYDNRGHLTNQVEAAGTSLQRETRFVYDDVGLLREQTLMNTSGQPAVTMRMDYDSRGNLTNKVDAAGTSDARTTVYTYDAMGNQLTSGLITDNGYQITASNTFDAAGRLLTSFNALGVCTVSNVYDTAGNLEYNYDALGRQTFAQYDSEGHVTNQVVTLNGAELDHSAYQYGDDGQVLRSTDFLGVETVYEYDLLGRVIAQTIGNRNWSYQYDEYGRQTNSIDPDGNATVITYDSVTGLKASVSSMGITQTFEYDLRGNQTVIHTIADGKTNTVEAVYDEQGNVVAQTDVEGRTQRMIYDVAGRVTGQVDALDQTNTVAYGSSGQVDQLIDANGNETRWEFDSLGQLRTKTYDDTTQVHYDYDSLGRLKSKLDANGGYTTYDYDAVGNLLTNRFYASTNAAAPERTVIYQYDSIGRIQSYSDGMTTGTMVYDDVNNVQTTTVGYGGGLSMTTETRYDRINRKLIKVFDGVTNEYAYGVDGKLDSVSVPGEGQVVYHYNSYGLNDRITLPGGIVRTMDYDGFGQLVTTRVVDAADNEVLSQSYQRSLTGSILQKQTDAGTWTYGYDLTGQLTNAALFTGSAPLRETSYSYDAMGNRLFGREGSQGTQKEIIYEPNSLNQYTNISTSVDSVPSVVNTLLYDLNGNLTNDGVRAYTWDVQNQLIAVEPLTVTNDSLRVTFSYDFMGRRISKKVYAWDSQVSNFEFQVSHIFFYDGWNLVKEIELNPQSEIVNQKSFVWGNDLSGTLQSAGGVGGLLAQITDNGSSDNCYYPCYDHNGNVEKYISSSGAIVADFQYDAFGNTISESVASGLQSADFPVRFSSKYWNSGLGLYYYGYRYYSPEQGRWIARDSLGELGGVNLYAFVGNAGLNAIDVLGMVDCEMLCGALIDAWLANAAYKNRPVPDGWKEVDSIHLESGLDVSVFKSSDGEVVISFRGTTPSSTVDWITDISQPVAGVLSPQYFGTMFLNGLAEKYPDASVVGHSLGGGLASQFAIEHGMSATTFNSAGLTVTTQLAFFLRGRTAEHINAFYVDGDILSLLQDSASFLPDAVGNRIELDPSNNSLGPVGLHDMREVIDALAKKITRECL